MSRPELPEAEHRVRQWLDMWATAGDGYAGKILRRFVREYDDRGRRLGMPPAARVGGPPDDTAGGLVEALVDDAAAADRGRP